MGQQIVVHACRKESVIGIRATVFKRQNCDRLLEQRITRGIQRNVGAFLLNSFNDRGRVSLHQDDDAQNNNAGDDGVVEFAACFDRDTLAVRNVLGPDDAIGREFKRPRED